ncbi:MAG: Fe-S cluster assembly protein SufD [Gemmatimonadetes bacterium]|nr:MAG: Fe-S cluster assembly protein SufD [Gemmatimonadota bacterium]
MTEASVIETSAPAEGVTETLNREAVERAAAQEPTWLAERRAHAWDVYERTPLPSTKLEEWRYTDVRRLLDLDALTPAPRPEAGTGEALLEGLDGLPAGLRAVMAEDREAAGHVAIVDGCVRHVDLSDELARQGIVLTSLARAVQLHPELLEEHLATHAVPPEEGKFQALNAALWADGVFLYVPAGASLDLPVRVSRWLSGGGLAVFSRTLIVAEAGARVSFVDEIVSDDLDAQSLESSVVEVIARDGAQVQYVSLQRLGHRAFYQAAQRTLAGRDATLDTLNVSLGASVARVDLNARLLGPGANSDMLGLYFGDGDQHFDHNTSQDHEAPNAHSDLLYKGALDGHAHAVFRGIIRVHEGAQGTDAYQTNRNLILSEHARADSLPNLEIEADDVRCSHGATVGQLDQETLFYLMSRGIPQQPAERLVVMGFLGEVLSRLPLGGVVDKVTRAIEVKLRHG